jgi:hypothetical protein
MRGRIALPKHFRAKCGEMLILFREARPPYGGTSPSDGGLSECVRVLAPLWSFHMSVYALIQRK